ncbi:hypothetical protein BUALT_Bualt03G0197300 [Buddleja alternifolia]|uniref:Uncharacterized protein n=1 Tax=Buddleja alternifolia TaxID=168488 RepID=A0AAV6XWJ5_9LAMI|nr:hypothetical protein BUALT_Bualt03G0197300 [Buddleja alternifolia]
MKDCYDIFKSNAKRVCKLRGHLIRPFSPKSPVASANAFESVEGSDDEDNMIEIDKLDTTYLHTNGNANVPDHINANGEPMAITTSSMVRSHSVSGDLHGVQPDPVAADILRKEPEQESFVQSRISTTGQIFLKCSVSVDDSLLIKWCSSVEGDGNVLSDSGSRTESNSVGVILQVVMRFAGICYISITVRNRMKSVRNIQKITKTMKMVAASKLRAIQTRAENSRGLWQPFTALLGDTPNCLVND